ncbi:hypothetical protein N9189_01000 [Pirellulaceae bacterium]|nr:hypothetical protein [Pirellulaceae bacterium]
MSFGFFQALNMSALYTSALNMSARKKEGVNKTEMPIVFPADVASIRVEEDLNDDSNLLQDLSNAFDVQPAYPC